MTTAVLLHYNHLQSSARNLSKKQNTLIKHKHAPHAVHCVYFLFTFGRPPISSDYRFTISSAFALFFSGCHVLSFSSQTSHFTSYSYLVPLMLGWSFAIDAMT